MKKNRQTSNGFNRQPHAVSHSKPRGRAWPLVLVAAVVLAAVSVAVWITWPQLNGGSETTGTSASSTPFTTPGSVASETSMPTRTTEPVPTTLSPAVRQQMLDEATAMVLGRLVGEKGRFAIYYQNLVSGETWAYQESDPFVAASSIKIGINTYLYILMASGEISPAEMLAYDSRPYPTGDFEAGTGSVQYEPNGTRFSVRDTSGLSIRISDNCATNMLIRRIGGIDAFIPYFESVSAEVGYRTKVAYTNYAGQNQYGRHRTCAIDLGLQAVKLYELWQASPADYQPLIDDLTRTEFDFGIQKGVPDNILVAHKIGTNGSYSTENDVGIVFADEPFALCVMTEMASAASAHQIQADVAAIFYELISSLSAG